MTTSATQRKTSWLFLALVGGILTFSSLMVSWFLRAIGHPIRHGRADVAASQSTLTTDDDSQSREGRHSPPLPPVAAPRPFQRISPPLRAAANPADHGVAGAERERREWLEKVASSGPSSAPWTAKAAQALEAWHAHAVSGGLSGFEVSDWQCFGTACTFKATATEMAGLRRMEQSFTASSGFLEWQGIRRRSAPLPRAAGGFETTWFLYNPKVTLSEGDRI